MGSHILYEDDIMTQFGLVSIRDFETEDNPYSESGEEVVFLPGHLFVAARGDAEGEVHVEARVGECDVPGVRAVFDGVMAFQSSFMCITGAVDPDEETIRLPRPGEWNVKVYVHGFPRPSRVVIFFDLGEWLGSGGTLAD